jgi:CHAD domain-containing protein
VGARPLAPLFHAHTRRERQQLLEADTDLPLAEVDLDHTSFETPGGATRELTRIEVECLNADAAVLAPWVDELRMAAQLEPANESKFRAGLSVAGLEPASAWQAPRRALEAAMPVDAALMGVLGRYFAVTLACESQVRLGSQEGVHQMRVAARHLDVLVKSFAKYAPPWAVRSRRIVRMLIKRLGAVRDCDVQLAYLDGVSIDSPLARAAMDTLRALMATDHDRARRELLDFFDAADTRKWIADWRREFDAGTQLPATSPRMTTAAVAQDLIRTQARKLRKRADRIDAHSSPDDYHEVRIRAKRLRYTLDAFAGLYGEAAEEYLQALARFQTVLGDFHDAHVRAEHFTALARGEVPAAASFAMGRLVERDVGAFDTCRDRFPKAYRRIRRRRWRALQNVMRHLAEPPP